MYNHAFIIFTVQLTSDKRYFNALYEITLLQGQNKWLSIGTSLGLSAPDLVYIQKNNHSHVGYYFRAMLEKWFESSSDCYLDTFLTALKSEIVDLPNLCPKVEEAILNIAQGNDRKIQLSII